MTKEHLGEFIFKEDCPLCLESAISDPVGTRVGNSLGLLTRV